jgi:hypothetical protein
MADRRGARLAVVMAILAALTGCSAPGPLATLRDGPQADEDRIDALAAASELTPESTRFLAEHRGMTFFVGQNSRHGSLCLLLVEDEAAEAGHSSCGMLPLGMGGEWGDAWLIPDGMDPDTIEGEWTALTPNLLVR